MRNRRFGRSSDTHGGRRSTPVTSRSGRVRARNASWSPPPLPIESTLFAEGCRLRASSRWTHRKSPRPASSASSSRPRLSSSVGFAPAESAAGDAATAGDRLGEARTRRRISLGVIFLDSRQSRILLPGRESERLAAPRRGAARCFRPPPRGLAGSPYAPRKAGDRETDPSGPRPERRPLPRQPLQ